jgi:transmembrane sensor
MSLPPAQDTYRTAVGERREIVLTDGSVVLLNTDTELTASYSMRSRSIQLDHGEALFKVEPSAKPFTVEASGTRTRALGTEFDVRSDTGGVAVTLYKGSVLVSPGTAGGHAEEGVRLAPGERVTVAAGTEPVLGKVDLEAATSWRDGIVRFNGTPLKEAVEEMNRYSATPIRVEDAALASERISGSFPAGEQEAFAESLALTLPLGVEHEHDAIVLVPASD